MKFFLLTFLLFTTILCHSTNEDDMRIKYIYSNGNIEIEPTTFHMEFQAEYYGVKITLQNPSYRKSTTVKEYIAKTIDSIKSTFHKPYFLYSDYNIQLLNISNLKALDYIKTSKKGKIMQFYCMIKLDKSSSKLGLLKQYEKLKSICKSIKIQNSTSAQDQPDFYRLFSIKPSLGIESIDKINKKIEDKIIEKINYLQNNITNNQKFEVEIGTSQNNIISRASLFSLYIKKPLKIKLSLN